MIGLRPGLQAFRVRPAQTAALRAPSLAALPSAASVSADTVALVGVDEDMTIYVSDGAVWQPERVIVANVAALPSVAPDGAIALAGAGPTLAARLAYVRESGAWTRAIGSTVGGAWPLTLTQALTGADPSGIGAVRDGDYGVYLAPTGVPIVLRYAPAVTVAAGAGGGTQAQWLPPYVYAGTTAIQAYLVGDETVTTDTTLNARGWPTVVRTNGTITSQTTRIRLATTAANGRASISAMTSGVTASTRLYLRWLYRVAVGNQTLDNATTATVRFFDGATGLLLATPISPDVSKGMFFWSGSGANSSGTEQGSQPALPNLSGTDTLIEAFFDTSTNMSTVYRDGVQVTSSRRIANATADGLIFWSGSGPTASQTASMDISRVVAVTC
jgi:hypothetical protein